MTPSADSTGTFPVQACLSGSESSPVGLVGGEQCCIHWLHAGGAGEGAHEPRVNTVHVVDVHARQEPDRVSVFKVQHTDHTPGRKTNTQKLHSCSERTMCHESIGSSVLFVFKYKTPSNGQRMNQYFSPFEAVYNFQVSLNCLEGELQ